MALERIVIPRVWRAEWRTLLVALVAGLGAMIATRTDIGGAMGQAIVSSLGMSSTSMDTSIGFGGLRVEDLFSPFWAWLFPAALLLLTAYRLYNVRYSVDNRAIEMRHGRLSWKRIITRIRFEDIRSIETTQSVVDQMLNIGAVAIGTAASAGTEVSLTGIANPRAVQQIIQREREEREQR